jgi:DNA-directed RNA polymerase subunit RPC12/RpoP
VGRVPITVMGYRCERCNHEWIPKNVENEPSVCPKCKSPYWNRPKKNAPAMTYDAFKDAIQKSLTTAHKLTWTEIRTTAKLPQLFPNNKWVHRLEADIGLKRNRDEHGIIKWSLG